MGKICLKAPVILQNILISIYGYNLHKQRYGKYYKKYYDFLMQSCKWNRQEIENYQNRELRKLISHCYQSVSYYKKLFDSIGLKPSDIKTKEDLKKIPILEKDILRTKAEELVSKEIRHEKCVIWSTGGTTGKAIKIRLTPEIIQNNFAFFERFRNGAGVRVGQKRVTISGRVIVSPNVKTGNLKRYNCAEKQLLLSGYHLSETNLNAYINWIRDFDPVCIEGYPSALFSVANHLVKNNISPIIVKCVYTYAEKLYPYQREMIEKAFSCKAFNQYGASEISHFAGECSRGTLHINPEYGIIEIVDEEGKDTDSGYVLCTSFINTSMPLLRYRIGDMASKSYRRCVCGWDTDNLDDIEGRNDEVLIVEDGKVITPASLSLVFLSTTGIKEAQIIQQTRNSLILRIVKDRNYSDDDGHLLVGELKKRIGDKINISLEPVDNIPLTKNGKKRFIVSYVNNV